MMVAVRPVRGQAPCSRAAVALVSAFVRLGYLVQTLPSHDTGTGSDPAFDGGQGRDQQVTDRTRWIVSELEEPPLCLGGRCRRAAGPWLPTMLDSMAAKIRPPKRMAAWIGGGRHPGGRSTRWQ